MYQRLILRISGKSPHIIISCRWSKPSCVSKLFYSASFLNGKFLRGAITNLFVHITSEIWDLKTQFLFYANQWFLGVMTTVVRSDVGTGCKGSWQICCFIVQRRGGKNRNVHVFPFTFYCFSLLGFCSVNSITCTLKVTVLPVIALAVATNLFLYSNYAQSMKGIRCDWGQQVVVDSNSQCALLQSWKLSFPIKSSRIWNYWMESTAKIPWYFPSNVSCSVCNYLQNSDLCYLSFVNYWLIKINRLHRGKMPCCKLRNPLFVKNSILHFRGFSQFTTR